MNCTACGKELNFGARFCSNCGQAVPAQPFTPPTQPYAPPFQQRIYRPHYGRVFGGVCAGLAQHFGWDVALVRILLCVLVIFGCGTPILAYIIAWIVIPQEPYFFPTAPYTPPPAQPTTAPESHPTV